MLITNSLNKTFTFFFDQARYKIVPNTNDNGVTGRMMMYAIHSKKSPSHGYETFQMQITIWGTMNQLQNFEEEMYKEYGKVGFTSNGKQKPLTLLVYNGILEAFNKNVLDENGYPIKNGLGQVIQYTDWQVNVNLNGHSSIILQPNAISEYKKKEN